MARCLSSRWLHRRCRSRYPSDNNSCYPRRNCNTIGPAPGAIAGLMQINVPIPAGLKTGSAVPISIVGAPLSSSQSNVTIAVR